MKVRFVNYWLTHWTGQVENVHIHGMKLVTIYEGELFIVVSEVVGVVVVDNTLVILGKG